MAFSHVWSLCIEEQFYLVLPFIAVFVFYRKSYRLAWSLLGLLLLGGVGLRAYIWMVYTNGMAHNPDLFNYKNYYTYIYYFTFCRLDPILCGVILAALRNFYSLAALRNFYSHFWHKITAKGNLTLLVGVVILCVTCYLFMHDGYVDRYSFLATVLGFPLLGLSFALLVTSSLSPNSILYRVKIWGAERLATLAFAIYLIQKPLDHITSSFLSEYNIITKNNPVMFVCTASVSILSGWLLYTLIETPFLKLRNKHYKVAKI